MNEGFHRGGRKRQLERLLRNPREDAYGVNRLRRIPKLAPQLSSQLVLPWETLCRFLYLIRIVLQALVILLLQLYGHNNCNAFTHFPAHHVGMRLFKRKVNREKKDTEELVNSQTG